MFIRDRENILKNGTTQTGKVCPKSTTHVMTTFTEATPIQKKTSELIDVNRKKKQFP